ncbi:hypothetical protein HDU76_000669, partial [Blyttiomyces sp. JEL0837]
GFAKRLNVKVLVEAVKIEDENLGTNVTNKSCLESVFKLADDLRPELGAKFMHSFEAKLVTVKLPAGLKVWKVADGVTIDTFLKLIKRTPSITDFSLLKIDHPDFCDYLK